MSPAVDMTHRRQVGPRRFEHPVYVDLLPPCNDVCPAGEDIQGWLGLAQAGKFQAAWTHLIRDNPLPSVHGRVCYHPCEDHCNRNALDSAVGIHAVERFLGDRAAAEGWEIPRDAPATGKRVLVIGAGPCGLSAAYHLVRLGHTVEIREAGPLPGGMLNFGIPAYRLPRDVLMRELGQIEKMGVSVVLNHKVEDVLAEKVGGAFDAVLLAIGASIGKHIDIPLRDAPRVLDAVSLLHDVRANAAPRLGRRVVVYGGGNTAMDAARTAKRLGADETLIVYRRDAGHMPAHASEVHEAVTEGVRIKWLSAIREISGPHLTVERMTLDENGRPQPTGQFETLEADAVVLALGQQSDSLFLKRVPGIAFATDGAVIVGPDMMTGAPGIFAGGDVVPGEQSVTIAVGHGKKAARHIDAWLRGQSYDRPPRHRVVQFGDLHLPIYSDALASRQNELPVRARSGFTEVVAGLSGPEALHEARRCLSCGNCYECDNCLAACPETAIVKRGPGNGYDVKLDLCTGCGACFEQCPCHAIDMAQEQF